jgi:predicted nucleic acid-binding protein
LRYIDGDAGSERVVDIIKDHLSGKCECIVSAIHWGEIAGVVAKVHGKQAMELALARLAAFGMEVVPATAERSVRAALLKLRTKIPHADAFGAELAMDSPEHVLVTADFDLKPAAKDLAIEFLPRK